MCVSFEAEETRLVLCECVSLSCSTFMEGGSLVEEEDEGEGEEEEDLDDALEKEFQRNQFPSTQQGSPRLSLPLLPRTGQPSSLTFAFPGWGVNIFRDGKRRRPSIIRHICEEEIQCQEEEEKHTRTLDLGFADDPGNGHCIYQMPHEIVVNVLKRLPLRDVCSAMRTCHWWQHIGSEDEVWERFQVRNETAVPLPRWAVVKHDTLSIQVQNRDVYNHGYFCKGFPHLRSALQAWWETETLKELYSSKSIGGLLHKVSMHNWITVYEFLGVVFSERADHLAALLLSEVKKQAKKHVRAICPFDCDHQSRGDEEQLSSNPDVVDLSKELSSSSILCDKHQVSLEIWMGRILWGCVYSFWKRYKQWLMLISEHCPRLNFQVMVEKARTTAWTTTPSLYEKGVICFRSQVLLKYGLRRLLQSGYIWLASSDANGLTSETEVNLLQSVNHLLQELDVRDDTVSAQAFTQTKMRRCFPIGRLSDNQCRQSLSRRNRKLCSM